MKIKFLIAFCLMLSIGLSVRAQSEKIRKTSVTVDDSKTYYEMVAEYNLSDDAKVRSYMNDELGDRNNFSFKNVNSDATMTLNDKTTFYMKSAPGKLTLKMDKRKNTDEIYDRFKKMCQGIRLIIENSK